MSASEITNLLDMLDTFDRGTGPWVNVADQIVERVRALAGSGELEAATAGEGSYVLEGVSPATRQAFDDAVESASTFGMEILGAVTGYEDERDQVMATVANALEAWRTEKDGAPLEPLEVEEEEAATESSGAAAT